MVALAHADLASIGIPCKEEYITDYCRHMGISAIDNFDFYVTFVIFRMAAIAQGVYKRYTIGGKILGARIMGMDIPLKMIGNFVINYFRLAFLPES